ncbi:VanZ family protein [Bacteroidales bacterium OttesenSCG-928-A17]|nr:VanZ family protein [Bacteroidales bacterium OttesenSCG-928-A17]
MIAILRKYWISIFFSVLILIACFISLESMPRAPMTNFDKLVHFGMFFFLGGCIYFENTNYFRRSISIRRIFWGSLLFPAFYGGLVELIQNYISPHRTGDWGDFLWDSIGAVLAFFIVLLINKRHN